jgi:hypothetical protein
VEPESRGERPEDIHHRLEEGTGGGRGQSDCVSREDQATKQMSTICAREGHVRDEVKERTPRRYPSYGDPCFKSSICAIGDLCKYQRSDHHTALSTVLRVTGEVRVGQFRLSRVLSPRFCSITFGYYCCYCTSNVAQQHCCLAIRTSVSSLSCTPSHLFHKRFATLITTSAHRMASWHHLARSSICLRNATSEQYKT